MTEQGESMDNDQIIAKIGDILAEHFEVEPEGVTKDSKLVQDLDLDSLDIVDFFVISEKAFGIKIVRSEDEPKMKAMRTVGDIQAFIKAKLDQPPPSA